MKITIQIGQVNITIVLDEQSVSVWLEKLLTIQGEVKK